MPNKKINSKIIPTELDKHINIDVNREQKKENEDTKLKKEKEQ